MLPGRDLSLRADGAAICEAETASDRWQAVRRFSRALARERGISMVEMVMALALFEIVAAGLVGVLTSATAAGSLARQRTVAQQAALNQIESIRSLPYDSIGLVNGNPPGTVAATTSISTGGLIATLTTKISYVNDPGPLSYSSAANYKKVVATVLRTRDSAQLAQEATYVAPPVKASASNAVINLTVVDYGNNTGVPNVPVALSTGPSAPRNDTTDASGSVFAGLTPNPTSGPQAYYDLSVTPPNGYVTLADTVSPAAPAHVQLSPGQTWATALYIYKPATIFVQLTNFDGTTFTGSTTVTVDYTRNATQYSQAFSYAGSALTVNSINNVALIPGIAYTVSVSGGGFYANPVTANVPNAYPTDLTRTFAFTNVELATVNVSVTRLGVACQNASVTIGGGPWSVSLSGSTSSTGAAAAFSNNVPVGAGYTITGTSTVTGGSGSLSNSSVSAGTNDVTVALGSGSSTC